MKQEKFEPFMDRLSRDIRNDLSESLLTAMHQQSLAPAETTAKRYLEMDLAPHYTTYIHDRLLRYRRCLDNLQSNNGEAIQQAAALWDNELFFEVHEVLEHTWMRAKGDERRLLQALIRAAGVYIKLEHGYEAPARKIAGKAIPVLEEFREQLSTYFDPERLITALRQLDLQPPRLLEVS